MIIDAHTHLRPGREHRPVFLRECRENGVGLAVLSCLWTQKGLPPYPDSAAIRALNDEARAFCEQAAGLVRWLAYLNPQHDDAVAELDRCLAAGAVGVKLWISLKGPRGELDNCARVLAAAADRHVAALIHTFHKTDGNGPGEITIWEFAELARRVPRARLIAAHAGGNWRTSSGALDGLENACVDVSGFFPEKGQVEALTRELGPDRVLFGSDMLGRSLNAQLTKVFFADIDEETKERVLWRNAARVFGLDVAGDAAHTELSPALPPDTIRRDDAVDHFCFCGEGPVLHHDCPSPTQLERVLETHGIAKAHAIGSDSLYAPDLAAANRRFAQAAQACRRVDPLATLDPAAPNWPRVLIEARKSFSGGAVCPYFHNWRLDDPACRPFFEACAAASFPLWINACTGDARIRHRGLALRPVTTAEAAAFAATAPENAYVFQGLDGKSIDACLAAGPRLANARFDVSRLTDLTGLLERAVATYGTAPWVLGSEYPLRDIRTVRWCASRQCARLGL